MEAARSFRAEPPSKLDRLRDDAFQAPDLSNAWIYVYAKGFQSADYAAAKGRLVRFFRDQMQRSRPSQHASFEVRGGVSRQPIFGRVLYDGRDASGRYIILFGDPHPGRAIVYKIYDFDIIRCGPYMTWGR